MHGTCGDNASAVIRWSHRGSNNQGGIEERSLRQFPKFFLNFSAMALFLRNARLLTNQRFCLQVQQVREYHFKAKYYRGSRLLHSRGGPGGYLVQFLLGMCRWPLPAPAPL